MNGPEPNQNRKGKMVVICSAKGGIGKTTLSVNLSMALRKKNVQVALLDGDFQFGDVDIAMDLGSSFSIYDALESLQTLDTFSLNRLMSTHTSGVRVLPAPDRPELADLITPEVITYITDLLLEEYDYLLVDTGTGLNDQTLTLMEKADQILLMTTLELVSIKNTKLLLRTLRLLEMIEKVKVVINRSTIDSVVQANEVLQILQIENPFYIPNNFSIASKALNIGNPFVASHSSSDIAKAVFQIAQHLDSDNPNHLPVKKPSLLETLLPMSRKKRRG
ncbi:AAA family ATPase [Neobacillus vireti]|uniref:AAA family ATPase n=1 Tax=Neobacillus vireti TaxID=220686 RepID=UPI002FFE8386